LSRICFRCRCRMRPVGLWPLEDSAVAVEAEDAERGGVEARRDMPARGRARGSGEAAGEDCCSHLRTRERSEGWREGGREFWKEHEGDNMQQISVTVTAPRPHTGDSALISRRSHTHKRPLACPHHLLPAMGMSYRRYLSGDRIYGCSTCKTHLATIHSMLSRVHRLSSTSPRPTHASCVSRHSMASTAAHICSMECKYFLRVSIVI
jgi:hypothetical protein